MTSAENPEGTSGTSDPGRWVEGDLESGADPVPGQDGLNDETGVGLGAGEPSTFEPEEDRG